MEDPTAKTADRLVAARAWKRPWLVTLLEAYGGRLAIEATVEPSVTERDSSGAKSAGKRGMSPLNQRLKMAGETPPEAVIYAHFNGVGPFI